MMMKDWFTKEGVCKFVFDFNELFVAPVIIKVLHLIVQIGLVVGLLFATFTESFFAFLLIVPGVFVIRFYFEMISAIFSINNNLAAIKKAK